ncbi:MAG: glycosyltransferase family 1 protein [Treponema sp.]|nr:glycosyltransferase family 1 protein [Treponema sp.]
MRIAFFTDTYFPEVNGVTNTLSRLGNYLDNLHINQLVIASDYENENQECGSIYRKISRFNGNKISISPKSRLAIPAFWDIDRICDDFMPDIIHVTTELGIGFQGMRYAYSRNIPLVMSYHTDYCNYLKYHNLELIRPLIELYLSWFYNFSCRTLVPSLYTLGVLIKKGYRNLDIWSRGIDSGNFSPDYRNEGLRKTLADGKFIFLYVGRLSAEKSLDLLLNAAENIELRFPGQTAFVFTGDGPYAKTIKSKNLKNTVLTGFLKGRELSEIYASADCFAFPSSTETFGNVVLEAMASGLPVAAVGSGGVTDFLSHNYNSLLCAPDNQDFFINNLVSIMQNNKLRSQLSVNAKNSALFRDWNSIFAGLVNMYADTIKKNRQYTMQLSA